jgi:E3 ubiquitin-protein ligase TRIP12
MIEVELEGRHVRVKSPLFSPVALVEGLVNADRLQDLEERLRSTISSIPELSELVRLDGLLPASHLAVLSRALLPEFRSFTLQSGSREYTISDSLLAIVTDGRESMEQVPVFHCAPVAADQHRSCPPTFRSYRCDGFDSVLEFASVANSHLPTPIYNDTFVAKVEDVLNRPFLSIGRLSPTFSLIFEYPWLFPLEVRASAFRLVAMDPLSALNRLVHEMPEDRVRIVPHQIPLRFTVDRGHVMEAGRTILDKFGGNRIPVDVRFQGELGSGPGVTREFFSLLSQQFRATPGLFRFDESQGLFPSPVADPQEWERMGTLAAKALSHDCLLELRFHAAFIELVRGRQIGLEDVDPQLARVLAEDLTGLDFEYPGYEGCFGCTEDDTVNDENKKKFVELVELHTVEGRPAQCASAFLRGFERVFSFELLDMFTAQEVVQIIAGDPAQFSAEEFVKEVELTGYERESEEVKNLGEAIFELSIAEKQQFLQFVTGAGHLPVGGLQGLRPHISVVKLETEPTMVDVFLPSSSVCANILRIPPYTTKKTLKSKLLLAISVGKDSFHLG